MIEYKLNLAGCECSIAEWNPGGEKVVLAFHGWLDNLATFEKLAIHLNDVRIIGVDLPGHGHSAHIPEGKAYHFIDSLFIIDDLIEHLCLKSANLLGHSMGGALATIYAAIQPNRVDKLLLLEALGPVTSPVNKTLESLNKAISQRRALKDKRKPIYASFEEALNTRAEVSNVEPSLIRPLVERALTSVDGGYTWRADSRLRIPSTIRMSEEHIRSILPAIEAPVLLIEGKSGMLLAENAQYVQDRKSLVKNLEVYQFEGGHHLHLEYPERVAKQIKLFLN